MALAGRRLDAAICRSPHPRVASARRLQLVPHAGARPGAVQALCPRALLHPSLRRRRPLVPTRLGGAARELPLHRRPQPCEVGRCPGRTGSARRQPRGRHGDVARARR
eukprot:4062593-Prymnesium_polylepis.1